MLRRTICSLLALIATLTPSVAGSQAVVSKHRGTTPPSADILSETFNNATNYDDPDWTATTVSSGVLDPNETTLCAALTGFGTGFTSECLESTAGAANRKAWTTNLLGALHDDLQYVVVYFAIHAMTAWTDGQTQVIVEGRSNFCGPTSTTVPCHNNTECTTGGDTCQPEVAPSVASAAFGAQLVYDLDGITVGRDTCGGGTPRACWRLDMRVGGVGSVATGGLPEILADTIYEMRFKVDKGANVGEALLGASQILSSQDSAFTFGYVRLGQAEYSLAIETVLYDGCKISSSGYVE